MYNFVYISKHDPKVKAAYKEINQMLSELHKIVKKKFTFRTEVIGSYKRNMITYDIKSNIGFDFDFNIIVNPNAYNHSAKEIKEVILLEAFKTLAQKYHFDKVENSTRVITLKKIDKKKSKILYSCDFAIVNKQANNYQWCKQSEGFFNYEEKCNWLIDDEDDQSLRNTLRDELRSLYLEKKNKNTNPNLHSRQLLAQTVHEMCQYYGYYNS